MGIRGVEAVAHGRPAGEALARAIERAKAGNPLGPCTVIVPSNLAGLSARRLLGGGVLGGPGLANVQFVTPFRLAELLSADVLADRRPLTNPVLGAAVRRALADDPGPFGEVAEHQATEVALAALYAELSHVSDHAVSAVEAAGGLPAASVRLFRAISARLGDYAGEDEVVDAAAGRADLGAVLRPFGEVIWYLPEPLTPALSRLLAAVFREGPASVVVALTGADGADAPVRAECVRTGVEVPDAAVEPPHGSRIVSVTDADEEVRAVVRQVVQLAEAGVRLDRIGVFYPTPHPYSRTLPQQLHAAGVPANGPSADQLTASAAGRTLLGALALPGQRWRRDKVLALVSGAPVRHGGQPVFPASWELASRRAGVVQDLADWRRKLPAAAARHQQAHARAVGRGQAAWAARLDDERDDILALGAFVDDLAAGVARVSAGEGWASKADAAQELVHFLLGPENRRTGWPEPEQEAAERVEEALARLATLDEIEPDPSFETFRRALTAELEVTRGRLGRFGEGVAHGPLVSAIGHDLDAVFVLGLTEGQCPSRRGDDSLLPDSVREQAGGELPLRSTRIGDEHRALLASLAAAPARHRYLVFPRGDLRGGRHRLPSRWLLDTASALRGEKVYSTEFPELTEPVVQVVHSYAHGLRSAASPASLLERDLAALADHVDAGGDPVDHPAASDARRGLTCLAARASDAFTEWDGNLAGVAVPSPARGEVLSATRLERWAGCGFRYFLADVLGLADRDDPERIADLSPLDRGSGVHTVLERFLQEVIDEGAPDPDAPWSRAHRARLQEIAAEVFDQYEASGRTGRPVHWRLTRSDISAVLDDFLTADDGHRARTRSRPVSVELAFGMDGAPPVVVELDDGRVIRFRGRADRVDATARDLHLVSDYKTGKGADYEGIAEGDPVKGGTTLQLGLYAEAALQLRGAPAASGHYWMVNPQVRFARHGYDWTDDRRARFVDAVTAIVDGIEQGVFAAVPGEWDPWRRTHKQCRYCDFDDLCPRDRGEQADAKVAAPELRVRDALLYEEGPA